MCVCVFFIFFVFILFCFLFCWCSFLSFGGRFYCLRWFLGFCFCFWEGFGVLDGLVMVFEGEKM